MPDVYVGLGSNLDPEANLRRALDTLEAELGGLRLSSVYRSPAVGASAPPYLNLVVAFETASPLRRLRTIFAEVERSAGRARSAANSARVTLDVDLLLYGRRVDALERVPRNDVLRHAFVLAPLAELAPQLTHPVTGDALAAAWSAMAAVGGGARLERVTSF